MKYNSRHSLFEGLHASKNKVVMLAKYLGTTIELSLLCSAGKDFMQWADTSLNFTILPQNVLQTQISMARPVTQ